MTTPPFRGAGIPWYLRENYARIREMFEDGFKLPAKFEHWLNAAQHVEKRLTLEGVPVVRAYIDPDTFPAWCAERSLNIDGKARMEFGNWFAFKEHCKTR